MISILAVHLQDLQLGLRISDVEEVVAAVAVTPLSDAPPIVEGVIDVRGRMVPVLDPASRFGLAPGAPALSDRFVIVAASSRRVALRVQSTDEVLAIAPEKIVAVESFGGAGERLAGVVELSDGLMLVQDLGSFLSKMESEAIDQISASPSVTPA